MMKGVVIDYKEDRGFGFIKDENEESRFFHISDIREKTRFLSNLGKYIFWDEDAHVCLLNLHLK